MVFSYFNWFEGGWFLVKILDQLTRIEAFPRLADNWEEDTWGISVSVCQQHFVFSIPSDSPQNVINFNVLNLNDDALRVESLNMFNLTQRVIFQNKKVDQKHFGITLPASISFLTLYSLHIQHTNIILKYKPWCVGCEMWWQFCPNCQNDRLYAAWITIRVSTVTAVSQLPVRLSAPFINPGHGLCSS